jgi:predicted nucleic acid-binding protein
VALIVDAGALYSQADRLDPSHDAVVALIRAERGPLVTSQVAAAEADYLILTRLGVDVELAFLDDLADGTFVAEALTTEELGVARDVARRHRDLEVGLADASLLLLARRFRTRRILTLDERCFRVLTPLQGGSFQLLPRDASPNRPSGRA